MMTTNVLEYILARTAEIIGCERDEITAWPVGKTHWEVYHSGTRLYGSEGRLSLAYAYSLWCDEHEAMPF
jgi:hypothetical protein